MIVLGVRLLRPQVRCYCRRKRFFRAMKAALDPEYQGHLYNPNSLWIHFLNLTGLCCRMGRIPLRRRLKDRLDNDAFPSVYVADSRRTQGCVTETVDGFMGYITTNLSQNTGNTRMNSTKTFNCA